MYIQNVVEYCINLLQKYEQKQVQSKITGNGQHKTNFLED